MNHISSLSDRTKPNLFPNREDLKNQNLTWFPEASQTERRLRNKKQDTDAKVIFMSTITPKEQRVFVNCKTAFAIWTKLAAQYLQNASANTHVLHARFFH